MTDQSKTPLKPCPRCPFCQGEGEYTVPPSMGRCKSCGAIIYAENILDKSLTEEERLQAEVEGLKVKNQDYWRIIQNKDAEIKRLNKELGTMYDRLQKEHEKPLPNCDTCDKDCERQRVEYHTCGWGESQVEGEYHTITCCSDHPELKGKK